MKKIIFASLIVITSSLSTTSFAQDLAGGIFITSKSTRVSDPSTSAGYRILAMNEVNVQAARDFNKKYSAAKDITWVENKNGASVYFVFNGNKMRNTYDKKGKREYTLKYYDESSMSPALRHQVKREYYDHKIVQVTEIERNRSTYFLVRMENDKEIITVKVANDEIAPFEKVDKITR